MGATRDDEKLEQACDLLEGLIRTHALSHELMPDAEPSLLAVARLLVDRLIELFPEIGDPAQKNVPSYAKEVPGGRPHAAARIEVRWRSRADKLRCQIFVAPERAFVRSLLRDATNELGIPDDAP